MDDPVNERLCVGWLEGHRVTDDKPFLTRVPWVVHKGWLEGHRVTDDKPFLTLVYSGLYIKVL
ncbi:hypothetical protein Taro_055987 [Colocasia esculenta]|uniref:Uncharacterized protein n=1 Tax=Colocasia esculenta TaxID=4460 RepID=A0A843XSC3_COLES|nr:hypothetical protein [Colocasia esculenta]